MTNARQACPELFHAMDNLEVAASAFDSNSRHPFHLMAHVSDWSTAVVNYFCTSVASSARDPLVVVKTATPTSTSAVAPTLYFSPHLQRFIDETTFKMPQVAVEWKLGETEPDEAPGSAITVDLANEVFGVGVRRKRGLTKIGHQGTLGVEDLILHAKMTVQFVLRALANWQQHSLPTEVGMFGIPSTF